jgi:hypothetical protein
MGRFARSWDLFKTSLSVVRQDKELLWMPVLAALASLAAVAAVAGLGLGTGVWPQTQTADGQTNGPGILLALVLYVALAFISLYFNAAVVAGASQRLAGGDPTVGSSLKAASAKAGRLFVWSLAVASVNLILQAVRERSNFLGRMLASVAGLAWNLATFFMVPVLLFEHEGLAPSVRRSAGLFKKTWGETFIGQGGLGLAGMVLLLPVVLLGALLVYGAMSLGTLAVIVAASLTIVAFLGVLALMSVLDGVYKAALYRYATTGQAGAGFNAQQLGSAFTARGS